MTLAFSLLSATYSVQATSADQDQSSCQVYTVRYSLSKYFQIFHINDLLKDGQVNLTFLTWEGLIVTIFHKNSHVKYLIDMHFVVVI
jgi:hypothetical protein